MKYKFIQNAGIGDILFLEPIARKFYNEGHEIYWPVVDLYESISDYIPYIHWCDVVNPDVVFTFQNTSQHKGEEILKSKYRYVDMDYNIWRCFSYNRKQSKELELMDLLGISSNTKYRLIHNEYATGSIFNVNIAENKNIKNIYMKPIDGFSIFDWSSVIENASEICVVSTSSLFLIEKLNLLKSPSLELYARHNDVNFEQVKFLLSKDWKLFPIV